MASSRLHSGMSSQLHAFSMPESVPTDAPRVHVTQGLTPNKLSPRVVDVMNNHISNLTAAQQRTDNPSETSVASFHVMELSRVKGRFDQWRAVMPTVKPFYAVKSNPHPSLVAYLHQMGAGFDCASKAELELVLSLGANPDDVIFAHPCKAPADILAAKALGVKKTTFDSEEELVKIKKLYPEMELVLRIYVDDSQAQCPLSNKYGCPKEDWQGLLGLAKTLNLNVVGVSFHVGSGGTKDTYRSALNDARELWQIAVEHGHNMRILDIGGGFPGIDVDPTRNQFKECADVIKPELSKFPAGVQIIAEPGRYFSAESQTLVTMIIGKKYRKQQPAYFVADGVYQSFNCMMYDHTKFLDSANETSEAMYPSTVFGQTCDGIDEISNNMLLPPLNVGDWVAFPGMGAYTTAASSRFNGFGSPEVVVVPPDHH